jgi:hypothetical protein
MLRNVSNSFFPCIIALSLFGLSWQAQAESFMDKLLSQRVTPQIAAQMATASPFNQDDWLARQHTKEAASQVSAPDSFIQNARTAGQDRSDAVDTFSQESWTPASSWEADDDLEKSLLSDIGEALGKEHRTFMEGRITTIEETMSPTFKALPKNKYGKLDHASVRYMLHRFFVDQHGWSIDGLYTEGAALNTSSPSHMLKNRVPMFVEGMFEKRLGGRGFGVHEMAVLVAVVEDSVHQEGQAQLKNTYKALGLDLNTDLNEIQVKYLIDVYMSGFVMSTNMSMESAEFLQAQTANMLFYYPTWTQAQQFFSKVHQSHAAGKQSVSFAVVSDIISELVNTFGTFHGKQCQGLKNSLKDLEGRSASGCIGLPNFYAKGLKADSNWLFVESPEYLRNQGVLDERDPKNPRLMAANYINSPGNCIQPAGYYMVCCHNECDDILGTLEKQLGKPIATPAEIKKALRVASSFNSASPGLRTGMIAPSLHRRLQEVADHHGGRVPIHGRLFAQWLHHVYPYECAYPHMSGSKRPQWVGDFEEETGKVSQFTDEEIVSFLRNASTVQASKQNKTMIADAVSCAPWEDTEELFAPLPRALALHELEDDPHVRYFSAGIAMLAAASALVVSMMRTCKSVAKIRYQPKMLHI